MEVVLFLFISKELIPMIQLTARTIKELREGNKTKKRREQLRIMDAKGSIKPPDLYRIFKGNLLLQ